MESLENLIRQMTLEEKAALCSGLDTWYLKGIERLGVPSILVSDGPHGLRKQIGGEDPYGLNDSQPATCFPTASALAATWNRELVGEVGAALGAECRQERVSVLLGPGVNIKRSPLCGRNFEYFSEDPCLTGELAVSYIRGVQSQGVGTSLKHYAANNQETRRMMIDALVDERALREIYLAGFEMAVREAQPWTVMSAYNRVNGTYASEHPRLIWDILKDEWGFGGVVVSDWTAMNERVAGLRAGVDLEMPGPALENDASVAAAVRSGALDEADLDRAAERILALIGKAQAALNGDFQADPQAHHDLARRAAAEGAVLLKNEGDLLPLAAEARVALIGRFARAPRYQGAGSSLIRPSRLDNLYDELVRLRGADGLSYAPGYTERGETPAEGLITEALEAARQADVVVVCAGLTDLYEIEGIDRTHLRLPAGHDALIRRVAAEHPNVVVVLSNGAPVEMPWVAEVRAVLEGYLGGQAGAGALAEILTGRVNPSGKLAETFPLRLEDTPAQPFPGGPLTAEYRESIFVGYRYYDAAGLEVLFPFGHGLSYTRFAYRDLTISQAGEQVTVRFKIQNCGSLAGQETAQVYVRDLEAAVFRPEQELRGFAKVALAPGEEQEVTIVLGRRAFAFYDPARCVWVAEDGAFEIRVGASSRDMRLAAPIQLETGEGAAVTDRSKLAAYYHPAGGRRFSQADFGALLGHPLPANTPPCRGGYTLNTPLCEMRDSLVARLVHRVVLHLGGRVARKHAGTATEALVRASVAGMSLRGLAMSGGVSRRVVNGLLWMVNGQVARGLWVMITGNERMKD